MAAQRPFSLRAFAVKTLSRWLGVNTRGYDAGRWGRFSREASMGRTAQETMQAAPQIRSRARYFAGNDGHAAAAVAALVTYAVGAGAMPANANSELVDSFTNDWWNVCDADGRTDFGGLIALMVRALVIDGECFAVFVNTADGLRLRLYPAEQIDESLTRDLGGGAFIAGGVEFGPDGTRRAYHIQPFAPTQQFDTYAPPVRIDAADVLHLMRPVGVGQVRGVSWLAPTMLKLHDLGLLNDALLKGFQVAAAHAGFLTDTGGSSALPFDGEKDGDALDVSLEPGVVRRLPPGMDIKFNAPHPQSQSIEFRTSIVEEISAALGVPAFMVSGNVSRANYSSLRAALLTFKAALEALQFNVLVPQALAPIWRRFAITEALRNGADVGDPDLNCEWRFPAMPSADAVKDVQATTLMLDAKLMSRREAIAARGETIERVDADIAADPHAQEQETESEDSNA
ncbi:phage portal protein [Terricaulis silvestris]|uniref:Phage portal protein, lambda family n=1 Tax=Terricaulis silvestris TaxID=2686094 RepID=A0A6I6MPT3_9CAUL|nr:phage portal protein [Terricaulis silvestris]QGZ94874.1 phage portal protein, lambda family [Terricaulis silvestris]